MPKADVVGLGRSGIAAARLLKQNGWDITISDRSNAEELQSVKRELEREGIAVRLGDDLTLTVALPDLLVVSPGVPWDSPVLVEARSKGIDIIGEIELAWRYLKPVPWIGITGTNGKTTTTAMTAAIFQVAGLNAPACGNIGYAACELALKGGRGAGKSSSAPFDWIIAEISSYQIESSRELAPEIGIWTTFTPDHLNRHKTLENYYQIKASLLRRAQQQIVNGDDPYLRSVGFKDWKNAYWTTTQGKTDLIGAPAKSVYIEDAWVAAFGELIMPVSLFKMKGTHNQQNLLMAVAAARLAGIDKEAIAQGIAAFPGVPHRLELICTASGVNFINDSKATNYDAALVGLTSVDAPVILIAGGQAKLGDDAAWLETIHRKAAAVLLIGEAAPDFAHRLRQYGYDNVEIVETLERAVQQGAALSRKYNAATVLFSPACASFDQYQNFEQRGDHFRQLCQALYSM